jgi:hypothetical protein
VRVTNIYEGTSQLQVVAAIGKLLGHALDPLFDVWADHEFSEELTPLKTRLVEATDLFKRATDSLKERQRDIIDYYAVDLVDMACCLVNCWLLLRDGEIAPRKLELAKVYIAEHLPEFHRAGEAVLAADPTPLQAKEILFT